MATGSVDLTEVPNYLAAQLGIPVFAAQILTAILFLAMVIFPVLILTKGKNIFAILFVGFFVIGFCVAIGWLGVWFIIVLGLITALLFASRLREFLSGD